MSMARIESERRLSRCWFTWVNCAAVRTDAQSFIGVKFLEERRQILNDALQEHFGTVHKMVAFFAIPFEAVLLAVRSRHFNDHADCSMGVALLRMAHVIR